MTLFSTYTRDDAGIKRTDESTFQFLDRVSGSEYDDIRCEMNKWFAHYPREERAELTNRLTKEENFHPVFYELLIHEIFFKKGFEVTIHPKIEGTKKHTDFLVKKGQTELYVEATDRSSMTTEEKGQENLQDRIIEAFRTVSFVNFTCHFQEIRLKGGKMPSVKFLCEEMNQILTPLNPESKPEIEWQLIEHTIENDKVLVRFILLPKKQEFRNDSSFQFSGPVKELVRGAFDREKKVIRSKSKKYGSLDKPLLICFNNRGASLSDRAVLSMFQGSELYRLSNSEHLQLYGRGNDGLFCKQNNGQAKRAAAVLITEVVPTSMLHFGYRFLVNAEAAVGMSPEDIEKLGLTEFEPGLSKPLIKELLEKNEGSN